MHPPPTTRPLTHPLSHHTLTHSCNLGLGSLAPEMESAVLGVAMEQLEEDFGRPIRMFDGTWAIRCGTCHLFVRNLRQYQWHVDHCLKHRRRSPVLVKKGRKLIDKWEEHCMALRSKGMDGQAGISSSSQCTRGAEPSTSASSSQCTGGAEPSTAASSSQCTGDAEPSTAAASAA